LLVAGKKREKKGEHKSARKIHKKTLLIFQHKRFKEETGMPTLIRGEKMKNPGSQVKATYY